jgi:hypothetical protein
MLRVSKKAECHAGLVSASDSAFFVSGLAYTEQKAEDLNVQQFYGL